MSAEIISLDAHRRDGSTWLSWMASRIARAETDEALDAVVRGLRDAPAAVRDEAIAALDAALARRRRALAGRPGAGALVRQAYAAFEPDDDPRPAA